MQELPGYSTIIPTWYKGGFVCLLSWKRPYCHSNTCVSVTTIPFSHYFPNMLKGWINYDLSAVSPHFSMLEKCTLHPVCSIPTFFYAGTMYLASCVTFSHVYSTAWQLFGSNTSNSFQHMIWSTDHLRPLSAASLLSYRILLKENAGITSMY